ncbi:hypothetical protein QQF64_014593 [Cirrhinus molitorella]|uniref:Uncharacterized protein n=1 Tax=Cirrhinus molitorella TaxID=172907 RepID=A0ABR3NSI5_9TELE
MKQLGAITPASVDFSDDPRVTPPGSPCPLHSSLEISNPLASHPLLNHTCQIHTHCLDANLAHMAALGFLERCHKSRD